MQATTYFVWLEIVCANKQITKFANIIMLALAILLSKLQMWILFRYVVVQKTPSIKI
jgi:hypothetical protein